MATPIPSAIPTATSTVFPSAIVTTNSFPSYVEIATWGEDTDGDVSFLSPNGVAIDSQGNVYTIEFRGNQVQKFTSDGELLAQWGSGGSGNGQFQNPTGIALDAAETFMLPRAATIACRSLHPMVNG